MSTEVIAAIHAILDESDLALVSVKTIRKQLDQQAQTRDGLREGIAAMGKEGVKAEIMRRFDELYSAQNEADEEEAQHVEESGQPEDATMQDIKHELVKPVLNSHDTDEMLARTLHDHEVSGRSQRASTAAASRKSNKAKTTTTRARKADAKPTGFSKPQVLSEPLSVLMRLVGSVQDSDASKTEPTLDNDTSNEVQVPPSPVQDTEPLSKSSDGATPVLLPRHEVVKRIWAHVKKHDLQDPSDKRVILCDDYMEAIFKLKKVNMFKMNKLLGAHLKNADEVAGAENYLEGYTAPSGASKTKTPAINSTTRAKSRGSRDRKSSDYIVDSDEDENSGDDEADKDGNGMDEHSSENEGNEEEEEDEEEDEAAKKKKKHAPSKRKKAKQSDSDGSDVDDAPSKKKKSKPAAGKSKSVFSKPYTPSEALSQVIGSSDPLPRHEAVKQIWVYIKAHDLQDPNDKRYILCDETLEAVLKSKRISMFAMNKVLGEHLEPI
ncbi:hypothetical protein HDU77_000493 [Chytriomyces hyalinus]|nr:hypothetical protein HDU77_000493 [Chytriomyces hyalinus]